MKTCSGCKHLTLSAEYITARNLGCDIGEDVFCCDYRAGNFNPCAVERCYRYRLTDEELYKIAEERRKYYAEHPEELERLRIQGQKLRKSSE